MGYRLRLGKVAKKVHDHFKGLSKEEAEKLIEEDRALYRPQFHEELYELGKYVDYNKNFENFYDFEIEENEFKIVTKEGLKSIIDEYHNNILLNYTDMLCIASSDNREKLITFLRSREREWSKKFDMLPYYLDQEETDGAIVSSWQYEYAIFNLVHIYRFFDWENDYLIYSGW